MREAPLLVIDGKTYFADCYDTPRSLHLHEVKSVITEETSLYQEIQIFDTVKHGRALVLDGFPQISERDGWLYTEAMVLPALMAHPNPARVLILGGGDGAAASFCARDPRVRSITVVDLDERVVTLTQLYLPSLWKDIMEQYIGSFEVRYEDAPAFLTREKVLYDIIISDITDPNEGESAAHLLTHEFFSAIRERLAPDGVLAMQSGEYAPDTKTAHESFLSLVSKHFLYRLTSAVHIPWFSTQWSFTLARNNESLPDFVNIFAVKLLFKKHPELVSKLRAFTRGKMVASFSETEPDDPLDPKYRTRTCFSVGDNGFDRPVPFMRSPQTEE